MKKTNSWARMLRSMVALMLVFSVLLCGCMPSEEDDGGKQNNTGNGITIGDGDGKLEAQDAVDGVSSVYGILLKLLGGEIQLDGTSNMAMQSNIAITIGDEIKTQLGRSLEQAGLGSDLSWFQSVGISSTTITNGDLTQMNMDALLNGKTVVSAEMIMDMVGSMAYISLPGLNDQSIGINMGMGQEMEGTGSSTGVAVSPVGGMSMIGDMLKDITVEHKELIQALPTEQEMNKLLSSYLEAALACLGEPTEATETLSHGGVSQQVTTTTYVLTQHNVLDMAIAVLTKAREDKDLEKALDAFSNLSNAINEENLDLYDELLNHTNGALEDLQDTKANSEDSELLRLCAYTADGKTVGMKLYLTAMDQVAKPGISGGVEDVVTPAPASEDSKATSITLFSLENDDNTAFYLNIADSFELSGTGTIKGKKTSGNYNLIVDGVTYLMVEVKDFTANALSSDTLEGTLRLRLGEGLKDRIPQNFFLNENTIIELQLQIDEETIGMQWRLYSGETFLLSVLMQMTVLDASEIKVPQDYVNVEGQGEMAAWLQNMNTDNVMENLEDADVPAELLQMLQQLLEGGFGGEEEVYPEYDYPVYED